MGNAAIFLCMFGLLISFNLNAFGFGIRIQASDFIIPILGFTAFNQSSFINTIKSYNVWTIILVFTNVFVVGVICHWLHFGDINFWGIKKIIGWFICIVYFVVGISLYEKRENILHAFIIASWIIGTICLIGCLFNETRPYFSYNNAVTRLQGLMGNPNAYGILYATALALQIILNKTLYYKKSIKRAGMLILALNLLGSSSRTAWGSFFAAYLVYAIRMGIIKQFLVGSTIFFTLFFSTMHLVVQTKSIESHFYKLYHYFAYLKIAMANCLTYSLAERLKTLFMLTPTFFKHPIMGIGLGGSMTLNHGQEQYTIHSTALWFLIEMGIIGFVAFMWFVYKLTKALRTSQDTYIKALSFPMSSFAIASLANELFYQRYFWLFAGIIICDYIKRSHSTVE